jgi:hypothetical protein
MTLSTRHAGVSPENVMITAVTAVTMATAATAAQRGSLPGGGPIVAASGPKPST